MTGFEVKVHSKKLTLKNEIVKLPTNSGITQEIHNTFGQLKPEILKNILHHYLEDYIKEKIVYTKKYTKPGKAGFYPIPYFMSALKYDYKLIEDTQKARTYQTIKNDDDSKKDLSLSDLKADLHHWQKMLEYSVGETQKKTIQAIILTCEGKLRQYQSNLDEVA